MREALLILAIILTLFVLSALRYRRQIASAIRIWRMFKALNRQAGGLVQPNLKTAEKDGGLLVNCVKCGRWIPQATAVKLGRESYFCSARCLEEAARLR